jgi:hypothetical protein
MTNDNSADKVRLLEILEGMDVPPARVDDIGWLLRNIGINNFDHPDLREAVALLRRLR